MNLFSRMSISCLAILAATIGNGFAADLILYNGNILTVDKDFSIAEAVAISDGRIVQLGSNNEIRKLSRYRSVGRDGKRPTGTSSCWTSRMKEWTARPRSCCFTD